jgi:tRNA pseudouridine55 synthase
LNGYLNIFKPPGETSQQTVGRVRRLTGERRVGHAGTLDPAAVGVLPVALGKATRLAHSQEWDPKLYWADISFGLATDTDDAEGSALASGDPGHLTWGTVAACLQQFVGDVLQRPPAYSAVHVRGTRAYAMARAGQLHELPPRQVRIDGITVVSWLPPVLSLLVQCRRGTYLRSLARDLGQAVECPAHLSALVRLRVGPFGLDKALQTEDLEAVARRGQWDAVLWPLDTVVRSLGAIVVGEAQGGYFSHGRGLPRASSPAEALVRVYAGAGHFLGLARGANGLWQPSIVLMNEDGP